MTEDENTLPWYQFYYVGKHIEMGGGFAAWGIGLRLSIRRNPEEGGLFGLSFELGPFFLDIDVYGGQQ